MPTIHSKLPQVAGTIFSEMSQLAQTHRAINLGQGFPDYAMHPELIAGVNKAMMDGFNQYMPSNGHLPLRERISEKIAELYGAAYNPADEITITPGGTYGLFTAMSTFLAPGDEVIVFEPAYDSYIPSILVQGAVPVRIALRFPDYSIPWDEVRSRISPKTKMILINSPHNPTGTLLKPADMLQLEKLTAGTDILLLSDEVYEHIVFDNFQHTSILQYPALKDRSLAVFSFGKVYDCTGWKTGYITGPTTLMQEFRKVHQYNCFSSFGPVQVALADFLLKKELYLGLSKRLQKKRDILMTALQATPLLPLPSSGSFFQCYSYEGASELHEKDFAILLTKQFGVAAIPVSAFYQDPVEHKVIRLCFAKRDETLLEAADRLKKLSECM